VPSSNSQCIPHAISVHPSYFECGTNTARYYPHYKCPDDGNLLSDDQLQDAIQNLGIDADTIVIVYGKGSVPMMTSARVVWSLMYAGVKDVRMLDGGFESWLEFGGQLFDKPRIPNRIPEFGGSIQPQYLACSCDVKEERNVVVDIRSRGEFVGTFADAYDFFKGAGHIPDAIWGGNWDTYLDGRGRMKPLGTIVEQWKELGIILEESETLVFYCGTGWRSCLGFLVGIMLGYDAKNYDDSFYGWIWRNNAVVKTSKMLIN